MNDGEANAAHARHGMRVRGIVQGVGFRPAVYRLARSARLGGFVRNDGEGVWIEVEGQRDVLARFAASLRQDAPALARIDSIEVVDVAPRGERDFHVLESTRSHGRHTRAVIPADAATCEACLGELFDRGNRRWRYPFINCVECGPRFTIVRDVPYDRRRTTMDAFAMCSACRAEYEDPADRRFHAEPNACPACGPRVALVVRGERVAEGDAAVRGTVDRLASGEIVAVKGLGGYQLAVDARCERAVGRLRRRKRRPHKPFAVMARDLATAACIARLDAAARDALLSPARPIVLAPRIAPSPVAASLAPDLDEIGVILPVTPLHHLLAHDGPALLVLTSGNRSDEPIASDEDEAARALGEIADAMLVHDRTIHTRADDSVLRIVGGATQPVRRARGFVPVPIVLGEDGPCVLAVGPHLKSTVCLVRGEEAYVSQHIGDLDSVEARAFFEEVVAKLVALLGAAPDVVAHDLHPEYASTLWAQGSGMPCVAVQHHHAHIASCLAEHGRTDPVIGVAFDGTGCGLEGDLWGGEFLLADRATSLRLGHLRPIAMAGGEAAIREPWRVGVAALLDAGVALDAFAHVDRVRRAAVTKMLERDVSLVRATGAGRWFDAVASILGVRHAVTYEGQAAIELEALAAREGESGEYPFAIEDVAAGPFVVDLRPTVKVLADEAEHGECLSRVSARFHATLAATVLEGCRRARARHGTRAVALSGGCFQNRRLTESAHDRLVADGFEVLVHRRVPPNDGGVSLGQAAVAAHRLQRRQTACASAFPVR